MLNFYDGNNWLRRRFEVGASIRDTMGEYLEAPGVFVFDGPGSRKRRQALYPAYKAKRKPAPTTFYNQIDVWRALMTYLPGALIRVPGWEADDVLATLVRQAPGPVYIATNDLDLSQLPGVSTDRAKGPPVPAEELHLYKTLVGDPSDNIPGLPRFGPKGFEALTPLAKELLTEGFDRGYRISEHSEVLQGELGAKLYARMIAAETNLSVFWTITALMDVPEAEIDAHTLVGKNNLVQAEVFLQTLDL